MENNNNENLNSTNEETEVKVEENDDVGALKEKFEKVTNSNKRLFERAKKAETEVKELKEFKTKVEAEKKAETEKKVTAGQKELNQSNEPDYAKLAYLRTEGVTEGEDIKLVNDEAKRLNLPLNEVLSFEHIKAKLQTNRENREAKMGMPIGGKRGGGEGKGNVDYWLAKGGLPEGDQELAEKVVDARMGQSKGSKFADTMFNE
jgi:hypothetical protein